MGKMQVCSVPSQLNAVGDTALFSTSYTEPAASLCPFLHQQQSSCWRRSKSCE